MAGSAPANATYSPWRPRQSCGLNRTPNQYVIRADPPLVLATASHPLAADANFRDALTRALNTHRQARVRESPTLKPEPPIQGARFTKTSYVDSPAQSGSLIASTSAGTLSDSLTVAAVAVPI